MPTRKVTATLDEEQLARIKGLVTAGKASTVSGFVQHAVSVALDEVAGWGVMLAEALDQTGGDLIAKERTWADEVLGTASAGTSDGRRDGRGHARRPVSSAWTVTIGG